MNVALLRRAGMWIAPDALLTLAFVLALFAPQSALAVAPADARWIVLLESALLLASILVGVMFQLGRVVFPLILLGTMAYLASAGAVGASWAVLWFAWGVTAAFVDGLRAHRGEFGSARDNIAHPHRRYDRVLLVYVATLPVFLIAWIAGSELRWQLWGALYFGLVTAADSFLRGPIDRIPRSLLRRMQAWARAAPSEGG